MKLKKHVKDLTTLPLQDEESNQREKKAALSILQQNN